MQFLSKSKFSLSYVKIFSLVSEWFTQLLQVQFLQGIYILTYGNSFLFIKSIRGNKKNKVFFIREYIQITMAFFLAPEAIEGAVALAPEAEALTSTVVSKGAGFIEKLTNTVSKTSGRVNKLTDSINTIGNSVSGLKNSFSTTKDKLTNSKSLTPPTPPPSLGDQYTTLRGMINQIN